MPKEQSSQVFTFYSYTGGVGRSMALSNVACLLARRCQDDRGVLMVDWNFESPSLHRFFQEQFHGKSEAELEDHAGLIDLFVELVSAKGPAREMLATVDPTKFVLQTAIPSLSLLKAGRFDGDYFAAVSNFQWAALYERVPDLLETLLDFWAQRYRFVLIDSTSGVGELSGLCTMMLPDKLVAAFAPSKQSLLGALDVARCAADYRKNDRRQLSIFPLACKIEAAEPELRNDWRYGAEGGEPLGYQARFEALFRELEPERDSALDGYFSDVQIPYVPRYSYGNQVAAANNSTVGSRQLVGAYEQLADRLRKCSRPADAFDPNEDLPEEQAAHVRDIERHKSQNDELALAGSLVALAGVEERSGQLEEALGHCLEAVTLYRGNGQGAGVATAASGIARLQYRMGRFEDARVYYLDAVKLYRVGFSNALLAATLAALGDVDVEVGQTGAAREHYTEALERYRSEGDFAGAAEALLKLAAVEKNLGEPESAEERYRQALHFCQKERNNSGTASALTGLAELQSRAGKAEAAQENYSRAAQLYRAERDNVRLAYTLRSLAEVRRSRKDIERAIGDYREALDLFRAAGENLALANSLQNLADLETRCGRLDDAGLHYAESVVLYRKEDNDLGVANALRSAGDLERRLGRFDAARSSYQQSMELYRAHNANLGVANCLQSLGDLDKRLGNILTAEQRYTEAVGLYRSEGAGLGLANSLKSLGDVETEAGNLKVARDHYEQAIEKYRSMDRTLGLANAMQSMGDLDRREKRLPEAVAHYSKARELYLAERHLTGLAYTCSELARVSHALFDFSGSIDYLNQATSAAKESSAPSVIAYVKGVRRELTGSAEA